MAIKNSNVTIMVKNMDRSISFYESLGFAVQNRWGDHYAQLSGPGITLGLHPHNDNRQTGSGSISIGFTVDNIDESASLLNSLSVTAKKRKEEAGEFLHFNDPDGTELYFLKSKW